MKDAAGLRGGDVPTRVVGVPNPPEWFGSDELTCWLDMCMLLEPRGQLSMDSRPSLIALCQCYAEWVSLVREIKVHGRTYWTTTTVGENVEKARPQVAMLADADRRFKAWLTEFGLTDASRGKANGAPPGEGPKADDPLAAYGLH